MREEIVKVVQYDVDKIWEGGYGKGKGILKLNTCENTLSFEIVKGGHPYFVDLFAFILSDKDVRKMILKYQTTKRILNYQIRRTIGMSGRKDYYINLFNDDLIQIDGKHLIHISCMEKVSKIKPIYIGDFVELVYHMINHEGYEVFPRRVMRNNTSFRYVKYYTMERYNKTVNCIIDKRG